MVTKNMQLNVVVIYYIKGTSKNSPPISPFRIILGQNLR